MSFENWRVNLQYLFTSNAKSVLGETAAAADEASIAIERVAASMRAVQAATAGFVRAQNRLRMAMGQTSLTAGATSTRVSESYNSMAAASTRATGTMVAEARALRSQFAGIGTSATDAAAKVRSSGFGRFLEAGGIAAAGTLGLGLYGGSKKQAALAQLSVQTGRSMADIDATFSPIALAASNRTGMSQSDAFDVIREVSGVIKDRQELTRSLIGDRTHGGIIDFANVLRRSGVSTDSPADIARNVITADHILNAYTQEAMAHVNDKLYRAVVGSHMSLNPLVTQLGYFGESFRLASGGRKTADDDILSLAQLGYWGVGHGKWGSGFGQILRSIAKPSKNNVGAMEALGILDSHGNLSSTTQNAQGEFTPMAMLAEARREIAARHLTPMQMQQLTQRAFPANAARIFQEALSPKTTAFIGRLSEQQKSMPDIMDAQAKLMNNLGDQTTRLAKNFQNLSTIISGPLVQPLTDLTKNLADFTGALGTWFSHHPHQTQAAAGALAIGAGYGIYRVARMGHEVIHGFISHGRVGVALSKSLRDGGGFFTHAGEDAVEAGTHGGGGVAARAARAIGVVFRDMLTLPATRDALASVFRGGRTIGGKLLPASSGLRNMPIFEAIPNVFRKLTGPIEMLTKGALKSGAAMRFIGSIIGRLGARAIPVVGEVLLLIDTLKFLGAHSKDIGKYIGEAAHWIVKHGGPMLVDGLKSVWGYVVDSLKFLVNGIRDTFTSFFNGGNGGIVGWFRNAFDSAKQAYADADRDDAHAAEHKRNNEARYLAAQRRAHGLPTNPYGAGAHTAGAHAGSSGVHVSGPVSFHVSVPPGTTKEQAKALYSSVAELLRGASVTGSSANVPRVGSGMPIGATA